VDEREPGEDLLLDGLRPAPADADHDVGALALDPLRLAQVGDEPVVGLLADRARVEEDEIGVGPRRRLDVPKRLEHALHALGVVLVHLAAERRDVVALHRPRSVAGARTSLSESRSAATNDWGCVVSATCVRGTSRGATSRSAASSRCLRGGTSVSPAGTMTARGWRRRASHERPSYRWSSRRASSMWRALPRDSSPPPQARPDSSGSPSARRLARHAAFGNRPS